MVQRVRLVTFKMLKRLKMHFHEIITGRKIDIKEEMNNIYCVFFEENHYFDSLWASMPISTYIDSSYFRSLKCSGSYLHIEEYFNDLNINFDHSSIDDLFRAYEFIYTILFQTVRLVSIKDQRTFESVIKDVVRIITTVTDKIGYKVDLIDNNELGKVCCITPRDALQQEVIEIVDDKNVVFSLIEYNSNMCKNNLKRKKELLTNLSNYVEPMMKEKQYMAKYKELIDDLGFMLNNLQIRHNNIEGKNFFYNQVKANLEEWYDKTYQLILALIYKKKEISIHEEVSTLKKA